MCLSTSVCESRPCAVNSLTHKSLQSKNEIFVSARLAAKDEALTNEVCTTVIVHADGVAEWKENLKFPIKIRDLPRETCIEFKSVRREESHILYWVAVEFRFSEKMTEYYKDHNV